jgi:outer membrane lipoprotein-sorting protein
LVRRLLRAATIGVLTITLSVSTGCLVRRRKISVAQPKAPLLVAGLDQLDEILRQHYADIETLNATVDMEPAVLSASKGEIANYKEVRGYILLRKPAWIRVIGLYPVVRSTAFDMVSDGQDFRLYLPGRNLFLEGPDRLERPSPNKLENLRPGALLDALLIRPPQPPDERPVVESWMEGETPSYIVHIIRQEGQGGQFRLARNVWFDRTTLQISRQQIFDSNGDIVSDVRYSGWERRDAGVPFPKQIMITRPKDEYQVSLTFEKSLFNAPINLDRFELSPPPGVKVQELGSDGQSVGSRSGG